MLATVWWVRLPSASVCSLLMCLGVLSAAILLQTCRSCRTTCASTARHALLPFSMAMSGSPLPRAVWERPVSPVPSPRRPPASQPAAPPPAGEPRRSRSLQRRGRSASQSGRGGGGREKGAGRGKPRASAGAGAGARAGQATQAAESDERVLLLKAVASAHHRIRELEAASFVTWFLDADHSMVKPLSETLQDYGKRVRAAGKGHSLGAPQPHLWAAMVREFQQRGRPPTLAFKKSVAVLSHPDKIFDHMFFLRLKKLYGDKKYKIVYAVDRTYELQCASPPEDDSASLMSGSDRRVALVDLLGRTREKLGATRAYGMAPMGDIERQVQNKTARRLGGASEWAAAAAYRGRAAKSCSRSPRSRPRARPTLAPHGAAHCTRGSFVPRLDRHAHCTRR